MATEGKLTDRLDSDSRKRLNELNEEWTKASSAIGVTVSDLRLLLEQSSPLQDLIRHIAGNALTAPPSRLPVQAQPPADMQQAPDQYGRLQQQCEAAQHDLDRCNTAAKKLQQDNNALKQERKQLKKQLQEAQEQIRACQSAQVDAVPELALLRSDTDLAKRLGLPDLPNNDTQALIKTVAVLSQRENLERLWSVLKDRCEAHNGPANASERALLETALTWHNHNWRTHPYRLIEAVPSSAYRFDRHLRSRQTSSGETVAALYLPGIADGNDKPLCKALVSTR